jgi:putative DNA methylase
VANKVVTFALKDAPALIEKLLPAQRLSIEVFKERKAGPGQTLTILGSYWKGRKPLIMNKACILGALLPATDDLKRDLEIFEMLMAMDAESLVVRVGHVKPTKIVEKISLRNIYDYFIVEPDGALPEISPFRLDDYPTDDGKVPRVRWREEITEKERRRIEAQVLSDLTYKEFVEKANRPEVCDSKELHFHIWEDVNAHLGTNASSIPQLVEQLGIMRFGHKPRLADTFSGSGQIPFEAARLGCDVFASDLSPIACMLTWGGLTVVGGTPETVSSLHAEQSRIVEEVKTEIARLKIDIDGNGWEAKSFIYCSEVRCPQTGWLVPLLASCVLSLGRSVIAELKPDTANKKYDIVIRSGVKPEELRAATLGTLRSDGRGKDPYVYHVVDDVEYRTKISTLRGDYRTEDGSTMNRLRPWGKTDFIPRHDDIFQERLYAVQWMRRKSGSSREEYEIRSVGEEDLRREHVVEAYLKECLPEWQEKGWLPDMVIEKGVETERLYRERGWTHWHHLFPPRHLLLLGLLRKNINSGESAVMFSRVLDYTSKLCQWTTSSAGSGKGGNGKRTGGASDNPSHVFYNQALNTFFNYGCRSSAQVLELFSKQIKTFSVIGKGIVKNCCSYEIDTQNDLYITDPPYGDAVKYEEILEFFIAWLRKNPPPEFADWTWDSRRALAIKGEDEEFRRGMVAAYKRMAEKMPDNGIQIIMFTHQSGNIWTDMANIVWASGLQVTAAWYIATETESAHREGNYVKGTVLLILRKRVGLYRTSRSDLGWEIQEEVKEQVDTLTGLNQETKELYRDENLFSDVDLQMAGYAAALRVLTRYAIIDGQDMASEAIRPRVKGQKTFVEELIDFAVGVANQALVPSGFSKPHWDKLQPVERFYLKMIEMEAQGMKKVDNYQNFAKAFKVKNFKTLMASEKANSARLKSASEFGRSEMSGDSELSNTALRCVLYALMELLKAPVKLELQKAPVKLERETDTDEVLTHLSYNLPNYFDQRNTVVEVSNYLAKHLDAIRPEEASAARILSTLVQNQKLG